MYLGSVPIFMVMQRLPQYRRTFNVLGLPLISGALIASSFATTTAQLILTQGEFSSLNRFFFSNISSDKIFQ
jgi:hypothetical protein